ncbi:MAG: hypothetical protein ACHQE5_11610, partial [Actinomycetes bacterium]
MKAKLSSCLAVLALCAMLIGQAPVAAAQPKSAGSMAGMAGMNKSTAGMPPMRQITNAQRKAAAVRTAKAKIAAGGTGAVGVAFAKSMGRFALQGATTAAPGTVPTGNPTNVTLGTPDYFGVANYANSPLPVSVSIQGDGVGAFATATVDLTSGTSTQGTVTNYNLIAQGSGYTFANVEVIGGGGSGATATATIDPTTGAITALAPGPAGSGYGSAPGVRKFVDALSTLGDGAAANDLGQYLPVAVADTTTFNGTQGNAPAADYYEIAVVQYTQKLHSDLPPTTLRGYVQVETTANTSVSKHFPLTYPDGTPINDGNGKQVLAVAPPQYLGPVIVATKDKPVRIKFDNYLPKGSIGGDLFLPVDPTIMGAGAGPNGGLYSQNRADVHLHGGVTPWISDGTPDQWTTPAGTSEQYPRGVSVSFVPDMWYDASGNDVPSCDGQTSCTVGGATTDPGQGHMTLYYTNQQSARLMFYHD